MISHHRSRCIHDLHLALHLQPPALFDDPERIAQGQQWWTISHTHRNFGVTISSKWDTRAEQLANAKQGSQSTLGTEMVMPTARASSAWERTMRAQMILRWSGLDLSHMGRLCFFRLHRGNVYLVKGAVQYQWWEEMTKLAWHEHKISRTGLGFEDITQGPSMWGRWAGETTSSAAFCCASSAACMGTSLVQHV